MVHMGVPYDPHGRPSDTMWESLMTLMGVPLVLCGSSVTCVGVP
jgi:hypothetical protein